MDLFRLFITSFDKGGIIMWPILIVSVVSWYVGLDKLFYYAKFKKARQRFHDALSKDDLSKSASGSIGFACYDSLFANLVNVKRGTSSFPAVFREFLIFSVNDIEANLSTMNAWISTAPLLGLLGTVAGMIRTFKTIMDFGIGNPHLMAEGISIALLTTQAGLTVAFPAMLFHNYLLNKQNYLVSALMKDGEELARTFIPVKGP